LRWRDAGETKQHERRTAQQQQTPVTNRHDKAPHPRTSTHRGGNNAACGIGAASLARRRPLPDRCQAMGGARAWKRVLCDAAKPNSTAAARRKCPNIFGRGKGAVSAGTIAPARWMSVQIGQQSSATSSRPAGLDGALRSSADACVLARAVAPAATGAISSRCTWPNETASWNASANSVRYDPNLERDRNQHIIVSFARVAPGRTISAGDSWRL
jgi:hypothetical protein